MDVVLPLVKMSQSIKINGQVDTSIMGSNGVKNENSQLLYWVNIFLESQQKMTADEILSIYANQ